MNPDCTNRKRTAERLLSNALLRGFGRLTLGLLVASAMASCGDSDIGNPPTTAKAAGGADFGCVQKSSGNISMSVTRDFYLTHDGKLQSNKDVNIKVGNKYLMRGKIEKNGHVRVQSKSHYLYSGHKFSGNKSCEIRGTRTGAKPSGCTQK